jgi:hypothetical protein
VVNLFLSGFTILNQNYKAPKKEIDYAGIVDYIEQLPDEDDPSIFGMNIYAENMVRANQANHLISSILLMQPVQATASRLEYFFVSFYKFKNRL